MLRTMGLISSIFAMVIILSLSVPQIGQSASESAHKEMQEAWQVFKACLVDQKHKAIAHRKKLLHKADAKNQELEGDAAKASGDAKVEYEKTIKKLKEMRSDAAKKLDDLGNSSADAWDATKEGFAEAYKDLYDAYKEAVGKFKQSARAIPKK